MRDGLLRFSRESCQFINSNVKSAENNSSDACPFHRLTRNLHALPGTTPCTGFSRSPWSSIREAGFIAPIIQNRHTNTPTDFSSAWMKLFGSDCIY